MDKYFVLAIYSNSVHDADTPLLEVQMDVEVAPSFSSCSSSVNSLYFSWTKGVRKGHRVRAMGVSSAVAHSFNEIFMHARAQASIRMEKANTASHGPRVSPHTRAKVRARKTMENPRENPKEPKVRIKVPKAYTRAKHLQLVSQVLKTRSRMQARTFRNLDRHIPRTLPGTMVGTVTNGTMAGVSMSGVMTGVLLDGTKVGNKRTTLPQAHFHLEVWMSVLPVVRSGLNGAQELQ